VSYASLARDIGIAPNTIKKYIALFEALCIVFRLTPFTGNPGEINIARSLLKEPKIYFYDTGLVEGGEGPRFENLIALALAKEAAAAEDIKGIRSAVHYIRTKDGKEADFCYIENNAIRFLGEAKLSDSKISDTLYYFCGKYNVPGIQIVKNLRQERKKDSIEVRKAEGFLRELE
jgi:predicted AAA+ superfamily ATPase